MLGVSLAHISPSLPAPGVIRAAASKGNAEAVKELLERKTLAAHLDIYLEDISGTDGCTALLSAVRRGDLATAELLANAGASMTVPSKGLSALHEVFRDMSVDEAMLNLLLQYDASPCIPDKSGRTALELALKLNGCKESIYKQADTMTGCILKMIKAENAFAGAVYILVKASWPRTKPVWKQRWCTVIPRYSKEGKVVQTQFLVFSKDKRELKDTLTVTEAEAYNVKPSATGDRPGSSVGMVLKQHVGEPRSCYTTTTATAMHRAVFVGMASPAGHLDWQACPELVQLLHVVATPPALLFPKKSGPATVQQPPPTLPDSDPLASPFAKASAVHSTASPAAPVTPAISAHNSSGTPDLTRMSSISPQASAPVAPVGLWTQSTGASGDLQAQQSAPQPYPSIFNSHHNILHSYPSMTSLSTGAPMTVQLHSAPDLLTAGSSHVHQQASASLQHTPQKLATSTACGMYTIPPAFEPSLEPVTLPPAAPSPMTPAPSVVTETMKLHEAAHLLCIQHDWQQLESRWARLTVSAQLLNQDTVVLRGLDSNVQDALGLLQTACDEAEKSSQEIISPLQPHEAALFTLPDLKSAGKQIIDSLEGGHRVRCWLDEGAGDGAFGGMNVQVVRGDLTQQAVTGIVNPTNSQLSLTGGVSKYILKAAGPQLAKDCKDLMTGRPAAQRTIPAGSALVTPCAGYGSIPCHYVIHAAGSHYSGDEQQDSPLLASTVLAVLQEASKWAMQSVAMPLIGAGAAGWPAKLAAQIHVATLLQYSCSNPGHALKELVFVDLNNDSIVALEEALAEAVAKHKPACSLKFLGRPADCALAMQDLKTKIEVHMASQEIELHLSTQQRSALLLHEKLEHLSTELRGNMLSITGCRDLVNQAASYIYQCNIRALQCSYPSDWAPMTGNTQLFEVALTEPAVAGLVQAIQDAGSTVIKVHRIQNQLLWKAYASNLEAVQTCWRHEPQLPLVNSGLPTLWHGSSATDPYIIYAAKHGFQHVHAKQDGPALWGWGTYYSSRPKLAMDYSHQVSSNDEGLQNAFDNIAGLRQILAVDVLTGKTKHSAQDTTLRMPPVLEDASVGRRLGIANLRYDSVSGVHPNGKTPIVVTYNSGHAYPRYLVTYRA